MSRMSRAVSCVCMLVAVQALWPAIGQPVVDAGGWNKARTLRGVWGMSCTPDSSGVRGVCELKCGKVNRQGVAKVSLKITPFDGKRISYRATAVSLSSSGGGADAVTAKWGGGYQVTIQPDGTFSGGPVSAEEELDCAWNAVWSERVGGKMPGLKAYFTMVDLEPFDLWDGRKALPSLMPWADGYCGWADLSSFACCFEESILKPCETVNLDAASGRWSCDRAKTVKVVKGEVDPARNRFLPASCSCLSPLKAGKYFRLQLPGAGCGNYGNLSCLRLSYNVKRGLFKGTLKIYTTKQYVNECWMESASKPQLKKVGVKVIGAVIGGEGIGSSVTPNSCARPPIHFRCRVTTQNPAEQYGW